MLTPPFRELARFAGNLATCVEAGVGLEQSLKVSGRVLSGTRFGGIVDTALERMREGAELAEALDVGGARWPPFFIPLLQAGEQTGRLDESLRYLEHHCQLLDGPARALHNAWFVPLCLLLAGTVVECALCLVFRSFREAAGHFWASLQQYGVLAAVAFVCFAAPCKPFVDPLKLALPFLGTLERELALNRFFCALSMLYAAGGQRVESMIRTASQSVSNVALRQDMSRVVDAIERGASITDAFARASHLTRDEKNMIATGDLSGTLEKSFLFISESAGESLQHRLQLLQQFSVRLTMFAVIGSIAWTILRLL